MLLLKRAEVNHKEQRTGILTINGESLSILSPGEEAWFEKTDDMDGFIHVFAIGSKGIPAEYGGFETFMHNLTRYRQNEKIVYHVSRIAEDDYRFEFNKAVVFDISMPNLYAAKAIPYDIAALRKSIRYCREKGIDKGHGHKPVFFIMACRIGPVIKHYVRQIHKLGGILYVNPDGHEWKRGKWSKPVQLYWKLSEKLMVRSADLLICDSKAIEKYIRAEYKVSKTCYISYGAEVDEDADGSTVEDHNGSALEKYKAWIQEHSISQGYYLMVGRFVPENNFETILAEYMKSGTTRNLVIITTPNEKFADMLESRLGWREDRRIKLIGTVYDMPLLKEIRRNAYGYIHGHEVGGTNPSLLEALGTTKLNLLYDCEFNREVAEDSSLYWNKEAGCLKTLLEQCDGMSNKEREEYGRQAKKRIKLHYSWQSIVREYENLWMGKQGKPG